MTSKAKAARRVRKPPFWSALRCNNCADHPRHGGRRESCRYCARFFFDQWKAAK